MFKRVVTAVVMGALCLGAITVPGAPAGAEDDPSAIPWTEWLPPVSGDYEPTSEDDCKAGRPQCVEKVIREMTNRFEPLAAACSHNAMFSLMYLRTTETYHAAAQTPGFFSDPTFINHQDVVFARMYFEAWDAKYDPKPFTPALPDAWRIAFDAADAKRVSSLGNMLLGMSAHVNRDLPFALANIGMFKPDGSSRKPDHDKVNQFLVTVIEPLMAEAAQRFDPSVDDGSIDGTHLDEAATMVLLQGWREQAWRNAERLTMAATPEERAVVAADIERQAALEAHLIVAATAYSPFDKDASLSAASMLGATTAQLLDASAGRAFNLLHGVLGGLFTNKRAERDAYCAAHWNDA